MSADPSFDTVSQSAHVWFGAFVVLLFGIFHEVWLGFGILLAFAAVKEFWFDPRYETPEVRGSDLKDFLFYTLGGELGLWISLWKL